MTRHCTRCDAEVADTGGYCLLGHPLRMSMETASLAELKQEVNAAFESAQDEAREAFSPLLEQVEFAPVAPAQPEPAYAAAVAAAPVSYAQPSLERAPVVPAETRRTAPPPPPPSRQKTKFETLWEGMEGGALDRQDPINAFAPPPSMDWGPERTHRKSRGLRRLRASNA